VFFTAIRPEPPTALSAILLTARVNLPARAALASEASGQRGHSLSGRAGHSPESRSSARRLWRGA
jgi:hypothetical protein